MELYKTSSSLHGFPEVQSLENRIVTISWVCTELGRFVFRGWPNRISGPVVLDRFLNISEGVNQHHSLVELNMEFYFSIYWEFDHPN